MATLGGRSPIPAAALLAHQGGWDEILLVAGPIVLILGVLVLARRRIAHLPHHRAGEQAPTPNDEPVGDPRDLSR